MYLRTCLLVTDDPDDHQSFSEAISEISSSTVLIVVSDSEKAIELLKSKRHVPDYIFLDLSMQGVDASAFLNELNKDINLSTIPSILYGEESDLFKLRDMNGSSFFNKDYDYSELRNFLKRIIKS